MPDPENLKSLFADVAGVEVDPADVERFMALAEAGVLSRVQPLCRAVQNNAALRRETTVELRPHDSEPDA